MFHQAIVNMLADKAAKEDAQALGNPDDALTVGVVNQEQWAVFDNQKTETQEEKLTTGKRYELVFKHLPDWFSWKGKIEGKTLSIDGSIVSVRSVSDHPDDSETVITIDVDAEKSEGAESNFVFTISATAVVIAIGGLVGGGILLLTFKGVREIAKPATAIPLLAFALIIARIVGKV